MGRITGGAPARTVRDKYHARKKLGQDGEARGCDDFLRWIHQRSLSEENRAWKPAVRERRAIQEKPGPPENEGNRDAACLVERLNIHESSANKK
jgi:hypothetical protein